MSLNIFDAIETQEAAEEIDHKRALAFVVSRVDKSFGDYLRLAKTKKEFDDRWSMVEKEVVESVKEHLSPTVSNLRRIKGAMKPSFEDAKRSKVAFQKNTWLFSPDLRVYTFEGEKEGSEFICPNCSTVKASMGLSRCSCGTLWNSWSVVEGGRKRYLCREIEDRDTILASAPQKAAEADSGPAEDDEEEVEETEEKESAKTATIKVSVDEQEFIKGWNAKLLPLNASVPFTEGFLSRIASERG